MIYKVIKIYRKLGVMLKIEFRKFYKNIKIILMTIILVYKILIYNRELNSKNKEQNCYLIVSFIYCLCLGERKSIKCRKNIKYSNKQYK